MINCLVDATYNKRLTIPQKRTIQETYNSKKIRNFY